MVGASIVNGSDSGKKPRWLAKVGLAVGSVLVCYGLVLVISRYGSWQAGIRDRDFRYENAISMWEPDPVTGFVNKRSFSDYCFGTVHVTTNEQGFRGHQTIPVAKTPGKTRILGLGDSVMWGTCVNDSETFLGLLRTKLESESPNAEVINAGVVGYSTLQELMLLENSLLAFSPDVVLVNFCENDLLPTEDPYRLVRDVYLKYLNQYFTDHGSSLTDAERYSIGELIHIFQSPAPVHLSLGRSSMQCRVMAVRLLLEKPIERMAQLSKANHAHLIYLLIPPRDDDMVYLHLAETVKRVLDENDVAYLDLRPSLKSGPAGHDSGIFRDGASTEWLPWLEAWLLPDMRAINLARQINAIHEEQNYIDFIHPSKKGNEIIAEQIFEYLSKTQIPRSSITE